MKIRIKRELSFHLNCNISAYEFLFWAAYIPWLFWYAIKATTFSYFLPEVTTKLISLYVLGVLGTRWFMKGKYTVKRVTMTAVFFGGFLISYIITSRITFIATMFVILSATSLKKTRDHSQYHTGKINWRYCYADSHPPHQRTERPDC